MPQDVKLSPDGRTFYVADMAANGVWLIDAHTMSKIGFVHTGIGAHGLYPSRDAKVLYVSNRMEGSITVLSFATRRPIHKWRLPGGGSPDMGGVSADGKVLWLSGRYNAEVYAISTVTGRLLHRIKVGDGPHGLCVWPQPGRYSIGHTGILRCRWAIPFARGRVARAEGEKPGSSSSIARAPLGRAPGGHAAAVGLGDRAHDREPQTRSARGAVARRVGAVEAIEDALALLGGNARPVVFDEEPDPSRRAGLDAHAHEPPLGGRVLDRVAHQVAQRLGEPVGVGSQRRRRDGTELEAAVGEQAHPVPQLAARRTVRSIGSIRRNWVCSVLASSSRSSTRRLMRAISACTRRSTRRTSAPDGSLLRGEHLELAADHGQRRAQLVRGVGDERALARERVGEPVEHVVEGVGQHAHLVALAAGVVDARVQVAGVHARGDRRHPAQRTRHARADQIRGQQRAGEREDRGEDERPRHAPLRVRDRASGSPTPTVTRSPPCRRTTRLSRRRSPTSGSSSVE